MKALKYIIGAVVLLILIGAIASGSGGGKNATSTPAVNAAPSVTMTPPAVTHHHKPKLTSAQANALQAAHDYVDMDGMSKQGLIEQLSSSAGDDYPRSAAKWAANHVHANWNIEAVQSARDYLSIDSFSRSGLIEQLTSSAGDKFTLAQATYAVDRVYGK